MFTSQHAAAAAADAFTIKVQETTQQRVVTVTLHTFVSNYRHLIIFE